MVFFGVILCIGIIIAMVYLAFNKKSSLVIKIASLVALGVMVLAVIVCLFFIFMDNRVPVDQSRLIVGAPVEVKKEGDNNNMVFLLFVILLIVMFAIIVVLAVHEHKKNLPKPGSLNIDKSKGSNW